MTAPVALRRALSLALPLAAAVPFLASPALAGGYGYGGGCAGSECYRYVRRPPSFGTVGETVMVRPPSTTYSQVPPAFETVAEQVLVAPGRRVWQVTYDAHGQPVGCWVTLPAKYAVQHRQVMVRPAQVIPHAIPAAYATRYRTVMTDPGYSGWKPIGGGYGGGYAGASYGGGYAGASYGGGYGAGPVGAAVGFAGGVAGGALGVATGVAGGVLGLDGGY